jgi:hypothetical protein
VQAYDEDFFAWALEQMQFLQERRVDLLDVVHLADEIKKVSQTRLRVFVDRMLNLLVHLFRWQYLPTERTVGLKAMIEAERSEVLSGLKESPSLKGVTDDPDDYQSLWNCALSQITTESQQDYFPDECPWSIDDVLSRGWLPAVDEPETGD